MRRARTRDYIAGHGFRWIRLPRKSAFGVLRPFVHDLRLIIRVLLMMLTNSVECAENPFIRKFARPYSGIGPGFRQGAADYGSDLMASLAVLGKVAFQDKAGFAVYVKEELDPRLQALKPATAEEEKMKAAAGFLRTVFEAMVDPTKFTAGR